MANDPYDSRPQGPWGPRVEMFTRPGARPGMPNMPQYNPAAETVREAEDLMERMREEPRLGGVVVDLGERDATIAFGPANTVVIKRAPGTRVGDRVVCNRNNMQIIETLDRDLPPAGTMCTVDRVSDDGKYVEGTFLNMPRSFAVPKGWKIAKGERIVLDPSNIYIIGNLGRAPAAFALAPKVSVSWDDIGGQAEAKAQLREAIELPLSHPELFKAYGKRGVKGVLLFGPPGTGKTLLAKAAATSIAKAHGHAAASGFVYVKGPELLNAYVGKSEEAIRALFKATRDHKAEHGYPSVVFLDECDALLGIRDRGLNVSVNATTVPQFLAEMDGLDEHAAMFILATNRPDALDPAVVREGRVDRKVRVDRPTRADCDQIMAIHLRGRPLAGVTKRTQAERAAEVQSQMITAVLDHLWHDERIVVPADLASITPHPGVRLRDLVNGAMLAEIVERASTQAMLRDVTKGEGRASGIGVDDLIWAAERACEAQRELARGV